MAGDPDLHITHLLQAAKEGDSQAAADLLPLIYQQLRHDILVEQARRKASPRHGGGRKRVDAVNLAFAIEAPAHDMLALSEALEQLETEDPRKHKLVMLRFFAGLTAAQAAEALGVSERTVERDWRFVRAKLHKLLVGSEGQANA